MNAIDQFRLPRVNVGLDIGQRVDFSAITAAEAYERSRVDDPSEEEWCWRIRWLEQLQSGQSYTQQADIMLTRIHRLADQLQSQADAWAKKDLEWASMTAAERRRRAENHIHIFIDITGVGRGVGDLLTDALRKTRTFVTFVTFAAGDRDTVAPGRSETILGKVAMVSQLSVKLEQRRIELPDTETARLLLKQLEDYERTVRADDGHESFGGKKLHDDLVVSLALATHHEPQYIRTIAKLW